MLKYANGALIIILCAVAGMLLASRAGKPPARLPIGIITATVFYLFCGFALAYTLYPNFFDHGEPAMASLGIILLKGRELYPGLDEYSFHGLLYGPLIAEIQAGAIFLGSAIAGLPVLLSSKLAGVLAFFLACGLFFRTAHGWGFARAYYTLFLIPFGIYTFWNRAEPILLLLVAISFWAIDSLPRRRALFVLGFCAGLACALKVHAFLYIAPAVVVLASRERLVIREALILGLAAAASFLLLFLPGIVSLYSYIEYLLFGIKHGLLWQLLLINLAFIGALWSPLIVALAASGRWHELRSPPLLAIGALQLMVAIVAAKPGAGIHHLMPFIPANALMFASRIDKQAAQLPGMRPVWIAALMLGLFAFALDAWRMARDWRTYEMASRELLRIKARYPDVVMGVGGNDFYPFAFMRPMLGWQGAPQIEYNLYMDLKLVGVPDIPLRQAFETCEIRALAMPTRELPYSFVSYLEPAPLFSSELRETFARRFVKTGGGTWFDAYECVPRKD